MRFAELQLCLGGTGPEAPEPIRSVVGQLVDRPERVLTRSNWAAAPHAGAAL